MKIITNKGVYLQVKDLYYLFKMTGFPYFRTAIKAASDNGNDFVLITNEKVRSLIDKYGEIVDFNEMYQLDLSTLSEYIVSYSRSSLYGKDGSNEYYLDGLRDVLSFKKGDLGYKIPLIKGDTLYDDGTTVICSSTISDIYYVDGDVSDLNGILLGLFNDCESLDFDTIKSGENTIIRVKNIKKKKTSILDRIIKKGGK